MFQVTDKYVAVQFGIDGKLVEITPMTRAIEVDADDDQIVKYLKDLNMPYNIEYLSKILSIKNS